jgi:hypothetical protein
MDYLLLPPKRPLYRLNRSHEDFLSSLKDHLDVSLEEGIEMVEKELVKRFYIQRLSLDQIHLKEHRQTVCLL